jgi:type III restriction enzyme
MAQTLESLDQVASYFKNHNVGFTIPYTLNGQERNFVPDFVAKLRTATGEVNLIIEVTGEKRADKEAKVATARTLWVPAVNNHGGFGRWAFVEIADPWAAKAELLAAAAAVTDNGVGAKGGGRQ